MIRSRLPGTLTACLILLNLFSTTAHAVPVSGQGTWETTLLPRDLDGDTSTIEAYFDIVLNITWLKEVGIQSSFVKTDWFTANSIMAGLNINGITGWRLPATAPIDGTTTDDATIAYNGTEDRGYNVSAPGTLYAGSTASELAHLFYNTLGNLSYCDPILSTVTSCSGPQPGYGVSNTGPFNSIATNSAYWTGTDYAPDPAWGAWIFAADYGEQAPSAKSNLNYTWAVHDGDVGLAIVPIPAAAWLFGSGLLGLIGIARCRQAV